jgi:hypothetical protein
MVVAVALAGAVAACTGGEPSATSTATSTTAGAAPTVRAAPGVPPGCPVTLPAPFEPPPGAAQSVLFGWSSAHGNGRLWLGGLGEGGVTPAIPRDDGSIFEKFGWWRATPGKLQITGRRLDAAAGPLLAHVPDGYGDTGFQASGLSFPTEGCWEVTGQVGAVRLTLVTYVVAAG